MVQLKYNIVKLTLTNFLKAALTKINKIYHTYLVSGFANSNGTSDSDYSWEWQKPATMTKGEDGDDGDENEITRRFPWLLLRRYWTDIAQIFEMLQDDLVAQNVHFVGTPYST